MASNTEDIVAQLQSTPSHPGTMAAQVETIPATEDVPLPEPVITTPRLILRPYHRQDAVSMQKYAAPAAITKYMSLAFAHPYTLEHATNWINMNLKDNLPNYIICEKDSPEICIGGIGLRPGSDVQSHTAELGYWVGVPFWGKGYTTEALQALTDWVFGEKGDVYRRLWASVVDGNTASIKCLEKCGYTAEGVMKGHVEKHGVVSDLHILGLTRKDWEERRR